MTHYLLRRLWPPAGFACLLSLSFMPLHAQTADVHGVVQDTEGRQVASVAVTLQCNPAAGSMISLMTRSNLQGSYTFNQVPRLLCRLEASASGLIASAQLDLTQAQAAEVKAPDLVLATPRQATPTTLSPLTSPPPTFQASGIRGLIDPGGYSAPAGAAAASSLLSGMADVRRAGSSPDSAVNALPCAAASSLLQAVRDHPNSVEDKRTLAEFYFAHGQAILALPFLRAAHQTTPSDVTVLLDLARTQIALEQFADARITFAELPSPSMTPQAHVLMAQAAEGLSMFEDAATQYSLAQEHDLSIENIFGQGYELILASRLPAAEKVFADGLTHFPRSVRLLIGKGVIEYLGGSSASSVTTFLSAIAIDPADAQTYPFLAQAYLVSGEHADEVRSALRNHLARSSGDATAYYLLALGLSRPDPKTPLGDNAEIAALLQKAITLDPQLAMAHFRLAILLARQNNNEAAAAEFKQVLQLQPSIAEAHFRLAAIYRKLGQPDAAAREMSLFHNTRPSVEVDASDSAVDLRQFISVMHRSETPAVAAGCN